MENYDYLKIKNNPYLSTGLSENPFSISPLFKDFKNKEACLKEEDIFVLPDNLKQELKILTNMKDKRALIYGLFGVGKTSFVDFILYIHFNYRNRFCSRIIITESNVEKAINELLLSICFDIVQELRKKKWTKSLESIRKWVAEKRYGDTLLDSLVRLAGSYSETVQQQKSEKKSRELKLALPMASGGSEYEVQTELRRSLQNYVHVLPMKNIASYLSDFLEILKKIGYEDIVIFIDEADHLSKLDEFLRMLTRSREILFTEGYTFFVAGSAEMAKYTEAIGAIFDKLIFISPLQIKNYKELLQKRTAKINPKLKVEDLFEIEALNLIFEQSGGVSKSLLRLAENSLDFCASRGHKKVSAFHVLEAIDTGFSKITRSLKKSHMSVLEYLASVPHATASEEKFQNFVGVKRIQLRNLLEELLEQGYVRKEKKGKISYYAISSQYRSYFLNDR